MLRFALCAALVAFAAAQTCEPETECRYTTHIGGVEYYWDFISLCKNGGGDYYFADTDGHDYYANVCGQASQNCLPKGWDNVYEYGVAVQLWGAEPTCDRGDPTTMECVEKSSAAPPTCCTRNCQVLGTGKPAFSLHRSGDPNQGIEVTFTGAVPAADDPYWCPWNPSTGSQYPRTVTYLMECDKSVKNGAVAFEAIQNSTETCDYKLMFKSEHACPNTHGYHYFDNSGGLSGGWIFIIILVVLAVLYFGGGFLYTYHTERVWAPPNREFWASFGQYISDGISFITGGCRGLGPKTAGSSPYDEIGGASSSAGGAAPPSAYNASSSTTAYTDL